jgi:hypothetical protein
MRRTPSNGGAKPHRSHCAVCRARVLGAAVHCMSGTNAATSRVPAFRRCGPPAARVPSERRGGGVRAVSRPARVTKRPRDPTSRGALTDLVLDGGRCSSLLVCLSSCSARLPWTISFRTRSRTWPPTARRLTQVPSQNSGSHPLLCLGPRTLPTSPCSQFGADSNFGDQQYTFGDQADFAGGAEATADFGAVRSWASVHARRVIRRSHFGATSPRRERDAAANRVARRGWCMMHVNSSTFEPARSPVLTVCTHRVSAPSPDLRSAPPPRPSPPRTGRGHARSPCLDLIDRLRRRRHVHQPRVRRRRRARCRARGRRAQPAGSVQCKVPCSL